MGGVPAWDKGTGQTQCGDGRNVLLGKCAIKKNKALKDAIRVPGCPPDPAKVVEIMTRALVTGK